MLDMIKKILSWTFFYIGDGVSRAIDVIPDSWQDGWFGTLLYRIYSFPMMVSANIQGDSCNGPWQPVGWERWPTSADFSDVEEESSFPHLPPIG